MPVLDIKDLYASVETKEGRKQILKGVSLTLNSNETQWTKDLAASMKNLRMDPKFAQRSVNEGFSGGEKKRAEVLQLELLKPKFAIMDETDSGLDVDALRIVSEGVNRAKENTGLGIMLITHYTRILKYIKPDIVHVFAQGRVVETAGPELADELEESGYDRFLPEGADSESALA